MMSACARINRTRQEQEFSDDEKEEMFKRQQREKKRAK